jgi:ABC-type Fe3+-citrate transport system substrate-binding protein
MKNKVFIILVLISTLVLTVGCEKKNVNHVDNYDYYTDQ